MFKLKSLKKGLPTLQSLFSILSTYLDKICLHFLERLLLKYSKNIDFLENNQINLNSPFWLEKWSFWYVWSMPSFLK